MQGGRCDQDAVRPCPPGSADRVGDQRARLAGEQRAAAPPAAEALDAIDTALIGRLHEDARLPAADVAARTGLAESTVRRRLARLAAGGALRTHVVVEARRLGLEIDANVMMRVAPGRLDAVGRALAAHPAVHGALATTGEANLTVAVWFRDLAELYAFVIRDLGALGVDSAETVIVGEAVKRPGVNRLTARPAYSARAVARATSRTPSREQ